MMPKQKQDVANREFAKIVKDLVDFGIKNQVPEADLAMAVTVSLSNHRNQLRMEAMQAMTAHEEVTVDMSEEAEKLQKDIEGMIDAKQPEGRKMTIEEYENLNIVKRTKEEAE